MTLTRGRGLMNPFRYNTARRTKLKEADVILIKRRLSIGQSAKQLAAEFGVSEASICDIRKGRKWGWVAP